MKIDKATQLQTECSQGANSLPYQPLFFKIQGAAHTCLNFKPTFVNFGPDVPDETNGSYSANVGTARYPNTRKMVRCVAHPAYNSQGGGENTQIEANDLALFFVDSMPAGFVPAKVVDPSQAVLPYFVTIAGFGAYDNQFDNIQTTGMLPHELRKVESFITAAYPVSKQFKDGPNPGKSTCQGDSGGSVYAKTNLTDTPILLGIPVSGPECNVGIGYDTDIRYFINWIETTAGVTLTKAVVSTSCGNSTIDSGETCDGNQKNCSELSSNFVSGTANCNATCSGFDTTNCLTYQPTCGDSLKEGSEICDSDAKNCTEIDATKYLSGFANCKNDCSGYDLSGCVLIPATDSCVSAACANTTAINIPDNNATGISSTINVANFSGTLASLNIKVNITHTYRGDLVVTVTSPQGTLYTLHNKTGSGTDNLNLDVNLTNFNAENPAGNWILRVYDRGSSDTGKLDNWSIKLTKLTPPVCGNSVKEGSEICDGGSVNCTTLGSQYSAGTAACKSDCSGYTTTSCTLAPVCGNSIIETNELCDGNTKLCTDIDATKYESGTATCGSCTSWITTSCVLKPSTDSCVTSACTKTAGTSIPDNNATGISSTINVPTFTGNPTNLNVKVNITHTYRGDLVVTLTSPKGTLYTLHNKAGGSADNLNLNVNLTNFNTQSPVGNWILKVTDRGSGDTGKLDNWSIQFTK